MSECRCLSKLNKAMPSAVGELEDCTAVVSLRSQGPVRCPCVEVWGMQLHSAASQCGGRWLQVREIKTSYASDNVNVRSATGLTSMQTRSDTHIVYRLTRKVGRREIATNHFANGPSFIAKSMRPVLPMPPGHSGRLCNALHYPGPQFFGPDSASEPGVRHQSLALNLHPVPASPGVRPVRLWQVQLLLCV